MPLLRSFSRPWLVSLAVLSLGVPLLVAPMNTPSLQAQESQSVEQALLRTITVTGQGEERVTTTQAQINLGIEVQSETAEEAQTEAARRSNAVVDFLQERRVEKLQTTGISLSPRYNYNDGQQTLVGFTATNTVSFRVANDEAGTIMDRAVKAGATRIDGISFMAEDAAIATAQKAALSSATADARAQANTVLAALGLEPKEIVTIQVNGAAAPTPRPMPMARQNFALAEAADAAPSPVLGGEQEVRAAVTLQIRY